jgi:hypothetical protein
MAKKNGYTAMDDPTPKRTGKSIGGPKAGDAVVGKGYKRGGRKSVAKKGGTKKATKKR